MPTDTLPVYLMTRTEVKNLEDLIFSMSYVLQTVIKKRGVVLGGDPQTLEADALRAIVDALKTESFTHP